MYDLKRRRRDLPVSRSKYWPSTALAHPLSATNFTCRVARTRTIGQNVSGTLFLGMDVTFTAANGSTLTRGVSADLQPAPVCRSGHASGLTSVDRQLGVITK